MELIKASFKQIPGSFLKFPVEWLLSVTFFVLSLYSIDHLKDVPRVYYENTFCGFFPLFVLTYSLNRPGWMWKIPYVLSYFLWIPLLRIRLMYLYTYPGKAIIVAYVVAIILLLLCTRKAGIVSLVRAGFFGFVLVALLFAVCLSLKAIFSGGPEFIYFAGRTSLFVFFVIVPMLSCIFVDSFSAKN